MKKKKFKIFLYGLFILSFFITGFLLNMEKNSKTEWEEEKRISDDAGTYCGMPAICSSRENIIAAWCRKDSFSNSDGGLMYKSLGNNYPHETISYGILKSVFFSPGIIADRKGIFHYVIGGNAGTPHSKYFQPCKDLYYFNSNNRQVKTIYHIQDTAGNNQIFAWKAAVDTNNMTHILLSVLDSTGKHISHLTIKNDSEIISENINLRCANYDFLIDKKNIIHLAYLGANRSQKHDRNSVFYSFSIDMGKTFSKPVLIDQAGYFSSFDIRILEDSNGKLHIIRTKDTDADSRPDAILYSSSINGTEWTSSINIPGREAKNKHSINAVCGANNVLYLTWWENENSDFINTRVMFSKCMDGRWEYPQKISDYGRNPAIALDEKGHLFIILERLDQKNLKKTEVFYIKSKYSVYK
jgi:hypothetical protein